MLYNHSLTQALQSLKHHQFSKLIFTWLTYIPTGVWGGNSVHLASPVNFMGLFLVYLEHLQVYMERQCFQSGFLELINWAIIMSYCASASSTVYCCLELDFLVFQFFKDFSCWATYFPSVFFLNSNHLIISLANLLIVILGRKQTVKVTLICSLSPQTCRINEYMKHRAIFLFSVSRVNCFAFDCWIIN